ncbi:acyl carrier protein [Fibrisoma montanum]|nr:phosphopantetheine-binding protein [Fibrisoma montanum]
MGIPASKLTDDADLTSQLELDELDLVNLQLQIELVFSLYLTNQQWSTIRTVGQLRQTLTHRTRKGMKIKAL